MADKAGMVRMADIRSKYPMYADVPDAQLLRGLWQAHYSDMPEHEFMGKIEFAGQKDRVDKMGTFDRLREGAAVGVENLARGIGQRLGLVNEADVDAARQRDAAIMDTTAGKVGNVGANIAALAPTMLIPGANTLAGAALTGAATGALQPTGADESVAHNAAMGGIAGPAALGVGRVLGAGYQGAKALMAPLHAAGQERIAANTLQRFAGDPAAAAQALRGAQPLIPGSAPTVAEVTQDAGLAQLQRALKNVDPQILDAFTRREMSQQSARAAAVRGIAQDDAARAAAVATRDANAATRYGAAYAKGIDPANVTPQQADTLLSLLDRPSAQKAAVRAATLAKEEGRQVGGPDSLQFLHDVKRALDDRLNTAAQVGIGKQQQAAIGDTKNALLGVMDQLSPEYAAARAGYAADSAPISQMDVGRNLLEALQPATADYGGVTRETAARFANAMRNGDATAARATGHKAAKLADVMTPQQMDLLMNVARDLSRKANANELGRAAGSNTAQNLASTNLLASVLGPTGLPQSWAESTLLHSLIGRPVQFAAKAGEPRIQEALARAMLDPQEAARLLTLAQRGTAAQRIGSALEPYLAITATGATNAQ